MKYMSNFNRTLLGKNIKYLAAQKGIKLGDLEGQVQVSIGYFSRLLNEDGKNSSTLMDTICKVADKLGTSVNTLISTDLTALTPNEVLLSKFFDKVSESTAKSSLIWELETKTQLEDCYVSGGNPLFFPHNRNDMDTTYYYGSQFDSDIEPAGDMYRVGLNNKWLYLYKVKQENSEESGYELYFISNNGYNNYIEKICKAYPESDLYNQIVDLYNAAAESSRHVKLSDSVLGTINEFMNTGKEWPEDIPF